MLKNAVIDPTTAGQIVLRYYSLLFKKGKYYALVTTVDRSMPIDQQTTHEIRPIPEQGKGCNWDPNAGAPPWRSGWKKISETELSEYYPVSC